MNISSAPKRLLTLLFLALFAIPAMSAQEKLVLSQVYGGGGSSSSSASYKTDFIEIFNAGSTSVDLSTYSVQYGPAGSSATANSSFTGITVLSSSALTGGVLAPGQYFLINEGSAGTGGATLVGADQTGTINLSGSSGKVALVKGTTLLSASGSCADPTIVNLVGYGTLFPTSCAAGSAPVSGMSISMSVTRNASCTDTSNNAADFTAGTPTLRNSSTTLAPCSGTPPVVQLGITSATASPASVIAGNATTLSVTVNPGSTSTGIAVTADLSSVGGNAAQALTLSSTPNVYTYALNVGGSVAPNIYAFPITVTDQQGGNLTGSISLSVLALDGTTPISVMQSNRHAYVGTTVTTSGVVTAVLSNAFFIQMPGSPASRTTGVSEGIDVFTSSAPTVSIGDSVTVTGALTLFPAASATPALEISGPAITTNSPGNPLPDPIALTSADLKPDGGLLQLARYESMRVKMSLQAVSGTAGTLTETTETYVSNGYFYAVMNGTATPYREPGVDIRDSGASALPSTVARFDDNPERIEVASKLLAGSTAVDVSTGALFNNVTGILDFTGANDSSYYPSRFIPDAGSLVAGQVAGTGMALTPATAAAANQATVAAFNIERFYNNDPSDDKDYYAGYNNGAGEVETSGAVDITLAAYQGRLSKVSLAIRHMLNNPDIVAIEEAENGFVLKDIAAKISADAQANGEPDPQYVAKGTDNSTYYSNDGTGISVGFLVKSTVDILGFDQYFSRSLFTPIGSSTQNTLDDRPPFVLHAGIKRGAGIKDYPVTVIVNHLKAFPDTAASTQQKKELQAEELAGLFQGFQANGEHVLAVGDFNAYQFNDGYGDYLGTITNNTVPAANLVTPSKSGLVNPPSTDLVLNMAPADRYSYVEFGDHEVLDHIVASTNFETTPQLAYVHFDSDFPDTLYNDPSTPARTSDHDPALAYITIPPPASGTKLMGTSAFPATTVGSSSAGQVFTLTNTGETTMTVTAITATGDFAQSNTCTTPLAPAATCSINVVFTPTAAGSRTGTLMVAASNGTAATSSTGVLTGTGVAAVTPDFTLDGSATGNTSITVPAGTSNTVSIKLASVGGFSGTFTFTCVANGTAPTGAGCSVTSPVTLAANGTATATVTITTTARTQANASGLGAMPRNGRVVYTLLVMLLAGAVFLMRKAGRNARIGGLLVLLFALAAGLSGCSSSSLNTSSNANGTPAGSYSYTVTATSGSIVHTENVAVTVQ